MVLHRGDICLVDFNPAKGGEIGKLRLAVVMSDGESNAVLATVMVIPLSTVIEPDALPYRYTLSKRQKLEQDSDACINEIRSLSKYRVKAKLAELSESEFAVIANVLWAPLKTLYGSQRALEA